LEALILQYEMFEDEHVAHIYVGGRYRRVPIWLWCEVDGTTIEGIIERWQGGILMKYYPPSVLKMIEMGQAVPDIEDEVLKSIRKQAKAMQKFMAGKYRGQLNGLENRVMDLELECMEDHQALKGYYKCEWIANRISNRGMKYTPAMVKSILDRASEIIVLSYETEVEEKLAKSMRLMRTIWFEETNKSVKAA
jgi:hypothetical protein